MQAKPNLKDKFDLSVEIWFSLFKEKNP